MLIVAVVTLTSAAVGGISGTPDGQHLSSPGAQWCSTKFKPMDAAKAMRAATEMLWACKSHIITLNVNPEFVKEADNVCVGIRFCYRYAAQQTKEIKKFQALLKECALKGAKVLDKVFPEILAMYIQDGNVTHVMQTFFGCAEKYIPMDQRYALRAVMFFKDFVTG